MKKKNNTITPSGVINFPYLNEMDTAFKQNIYKITEFWIKREDCTNFINEINELTENEYMRNKKAGKEVVKAFAYEDKGEYFLFKNKFKSQYKPKQIEQINGKLEFVDKEIKAGSIVQLAVTINPYTMMGKCGVSFYIDAVRIIKLKDNFDIITKKKEEKTSADFGFSIEENDLKNIDEEINELGFNIEEDIDADLEEDEVIDF